MNKQQLTIVPEFSQRRITANMVVYQMSDEKFEALKEQIRQLIIYNTDVVSFSIGESYDA